MADVHNGSSAHNAGEQSPDGAKPNDLSASTELPPNSAATFASSHDGDPHARIATLEHDLERTQDEREALANQYRTLLGKLTAMRQSLGDKLREDAEELDRRETQITALTSELATLQGNLSHTRNELSMMSTENTQLSSQLAQVRYESSSSSSDIVSLTRELRELRGEMEMLRVEREEWEVEAGHERKRREEFEDEARRWERRCMEETRRASAVEEELTRERERAANLQDVLEVFQAGKDVEIRQAQTELETQLRSVVHSLAEYKIRAHEAETRLEDISNDTTKSAKLEKELKEKNAMIGKLRHDAVVTQEHLTEALRRLRRNTSETNVDRRLVNNVLLQFLCTPRADAKRFEMLALLSTILGWDDDEQEKAGLQRGSGSRRKGKQKDEPAAQRSKEEEDTFNESFSNLFVEFLLKEAAQGQSPTASTFPINTAAGTASPPLFPPTSGFQRNRTLSSTSVVSTISGMGPMGSSGMRSPPSLGAYGRKFSLGLAVNGVVPSESGGISPPGRVPEPRRTDP